MRSPVVAFVLVFSVLECVAGDSLSVRFLAVGDVNLGRTVGQVLLGGDTLYPFLYAGDTLRAHDLVLANLESNISDQNGRTEHPSSNMIFTAPPAAAASLRRGGISVVATANNHAVDFGLGALHATRRYLQEAGVIFVGTGANRAEAYAPAIVRVRGLRIAIFAVTAFMNGTSLPWREYVAAADTGELFPRVRSCRDSVDFVLVSYHGGAEYADTPSREVRTFARNALENGVDLFLGHHPHVPYGYEGRGDRLAFHSLGNFVFRQPQRMWTQYGVAVSATLIKDAAGSRIAGVRCLPVRAGFQPVFLGPGEEASRVLERVRRLTTPIDRELTSW